MNFIANESAQKLRGGYYTPLDLASFLARWLSERSPASLLEPSCGDGAFFRALASIGRFKSTKITAFELNHSEARKAARTARDLSLTARVRPEDFLGWALRQLDGKTRFGAVAGNPPFVRYQYLPPEFQAVSEQIFQRLALPFTKHTNAWVPFILASMSLLEPGGRLAMVVPSEIIHVLHAQSLRSYLGRECRRVVLIDPEDLWFDGALQGAVLLMAEKRASEHDAIEGLGIYPVKGREFLTIDPTVVFNAPQCLNGHTVEGKWTRALLSKSTRDLIDEVQDHPDVHIFRDIADVDVGIVTGANKYFLVTDDVVERHRLHKWAHPMFGRSGHCPGVIYDDQQHRANAKEGNPTNFLWFRGDRLTESAKTYVKIGEQQNLHRRYKCRVRSPWYVVPSVYSTEIGMLKRSHDTPRLILNTLGAYTTDTAYRIRSKHEPAERLVCCFFSPLTALSAELEGRHYGGGVLELVPSEIERLAVALPPKVSVDLTTLDRTVRSQQATRVLQSHGGKILSALGLPQRKQDDLMNAWAALRDRRHRTSSTEVPASIDLD
jgi:adenine-specific DNA methylase